MSGYVRCLCCNQPIPVTWEDVGLGVTCPRTRKLVPVKASDVQRPAPTKPPVAPRPSRPTPPARKPSRAKSAAPASAPNWSAEKIAVIAGAVVGVVILTGVATVLVTKSRHKPEQEIALHTPEPAAPPVPTAPVSPRVDPRPIVSPSRSEPTAAPLPRVVEARPMELMEPSEPVIPAGPPALKPLPAAVAEKPPVKPAAPITQDALLQQLFDVPEFSLPGVDALRESQLKYANAHSPGAAKEGKRDPAQEDQIAKALGQLLLQADKAGLPVRNGKSCTLTPRAAEALGRGAADLRWSAKWAGVTGQPTLMTANLDRKANGQVSILDANGRSVMTVTGLPRSTLRPAKDLRKLFKEIWPAENVEKRFDVVPVIVQVLQVEDEDYRQLLVEELARIPGPDASRALAKRALYDTSSDIRRAARAALQKRPVNEFRDVLLKGFEFPWAPVADHAAEALLEIKDTQAVPRLVEMLDQHDPAAPYPDGMTKQHKVQELVRINHMRNCCLCHAPSHNPTDWVQGRIMEPGKPIPVEYYGSPSGAFVRGDITHLRPDFSVMQPVNDADPWPKMQRFDYVIRTRLATEEEIARDAKRPVGASYPQREALLTALRGLSGQDLGTTADPWRKYAAETFDKPGKE